MGGTLGFWLVPLLGKPYSCILLQNPYVRVPVNYCWLPVMLQAAFWLVFACSMSPQQLLRWKTRARIKQVLCEQSPSLAWQLQQRQLPRGSAALKLSLKSAGFPFSHAAVRGARTQSEHLLGGDDNDHRCHLVTLSLQKGFEAPVTEPVLGNDVLPELSSHKCHSATEERLS